MLSVEALGWALSALAGVLLLALQFIARPRLRSADGNGRAGSRKRAAAPD